ncbi:hypothetical protein GOP47_0014978 [Adiantum capillus-veneris]|uniref:Uncharacterized protein n=1 Tax=Adiantum capillus-veneris TaxID=13818 RepID=A0A9D4UMH1_ADICA|nr:hypothetical protein GOP47_0014978 [Adiantum capillus-veneris]
MWKFEEIRFQEKRISIKLEAKAAEFDAFRYKRDINSSKPEGLWLCPPFFGCVATVLQGKRTYRYLVPARPHSSPCNTGN